MPIELVVLMVGGAAAASFLWLLYVVFTAPQFMQEQRRLREECKKFLSR